MASLIAKKKANTLYYYVVESARVEGKPRIVHQTYLGTAERVAALIKDSTAPVPLSATAIAFGLPGALWLAAERSGAFAALTSLWPTPRSGPSTAHYLLLATIHRICEPGPKTEVSDWYRHSILHSLWGFPPERFTSQAFWDCFDQIESAAPGAADQLQQAQTRLLGAWKDKHLISRRLLAYDTTNFHTYIATAPTNAVNWPNAATTNKAGTTSAKSASVTSSMANPASACVITSTRAILPTPMNCPPRWSGSARYSTSKRSRATR
jgi:hypothetical protein